MATGTLFELIANLKSAQKLEFFKLDGGIVMMLTRKGKGGHACKLDPLSIDDETIRLALRDMKECKDMEIKQKRIAARAAKKQAAPITRPATAESIV
jgi:hypothetical protein